jgi:hypothetical protein
LYAPSLLSTPPERPLTSAPPSDVTYILSRSPLSPKNIHDAAFFGVSPIVYTTWALLLGQLSTLLEWALSRELKKAREEAYEATVRSRGKEEGWWGEYEEEWLEPPVGKAQRAAEKQGFYQKLSTPLVRVVLLKGAFSRSSSLSLSANLRSLRAVLLTPLSFIPFLSLTVMAAIRSLTLGRNLHRPFFAAKKMSYVCTLTFLLRPSLTIAIHFRPTQVDLWVTERQLQYRSFGFVASLLERIPFVGLFFSISNRIGAAMWAHDVSFSFFREVLLSLFSLTAL